MEPFFAPEHAFDRAASMGEQIPNQLQLLSLALSRHMDVAVATTTCRPANGSKALERPGTAFRSRPPKAADSNCSRATPRTLHNARR